MADAADQAYEISEHHLALGIAQTTFRVQPGEPGQCRECDEDMPRLVNGRCAPCRDGRDSIAIKDRRA